jgi:glutathione peroxidase-family protein
LHGQFNTKLTFYSNQKLFTTQYKNMQTNYNTWKEDKMQVLSFFFIFFL